MINLHLFSVKGTLEVYLKMNQSERACWEIKPVPTNDRVEQNAPKARAPRKYAKARKSSNRPRAAAAKSSAPPAVPTQEAEEDESSDEEQNMRVFRIPEPSCSK